MASTGKQYQPEDCRNCTYRSLRMFCNLAEDALSHFDNMGTQLLVPRGAILFREGDASRVVQVICKGQVKLSCSSSEGRTLILKVAMSGDVLGLGAVISGMPYEVTADGRWSRRC